MKKIARFHFVLENGDPLVISYILHDTSLRDRWTQLVDTRNLDPEPKFNLSIANKTTANIPQLMSEINTIVSKINQYYDKILPEFTDTTDIDRVKLNYLHEEFENYGERHAACMAEQSYGTGDDTWQRKRFNLGFHETWLKLNEKIHHTESAMMCSPDDPFFMCSTQFYPFEQGMPIKPEDKLFLTTDIDWGDLYLGYNTLGKDYMDTCEDNDVRVITNGQIKVQEYFSTEVYLNFGVAGYKKSMESNFWKWYSQLPAETQKLIPITDRNALSLGRYFIGSVIFDNAFLDLHPILEDWENGNKDIRKKWSLEVFSKVKEIVKIVVVSQEEYKQECLDVQG